MRNRVLKTVFTLAFLGSVACPALAEAPSSQSEVWVVGPIRADHAGAPQFCSMKKTFPAGQAVVFARDVGGSDSIAFDFGTKTMEAGHSYPITLSAGAVTRTVSAIAATQRVLLVNLGEDVAFYENLEVASPLSLTLMSKAYPYDMAGAGDALPTLRECAQALVPSKKDTPVAKAVKRTVKTTARDDDAVLAKLKAENAALQQSLDSAKREVELQKDAARIVQEKLASRRARSVDEIIADAGVIPTHASQAPVAGGVAYVWQADRLFASAEKMPVAQGRNFGGMVADYIARMAARCAGDFAHTAALPQATGSLTFEEVEMACIDGKNDAAAALLFVSDGKRFIALSQEGSQQQMEGALAIRDAHATAITARASGF